MNQKTYGSNFGLKINGKTHSHQTQNNEKYFLSRQKSKIQLGLPGSAWIPDAHDLLAGFFLEWHTEWKDAWDKLGL